MPYSLKTWRSQRGLTKSVGVSSRTFLLPFSFISRSTPMASSTGSVGGAASQATVLVLEMVEVVEVSGHHQPFGLFDARHESLPAHQLLHDRIRVLAALPSRDQ